MSTPIRRINHFLTIDVASGVEEVSGGAGLRFVRAERAVAAGGADVAGDVVGRVGDACAAGTVVARPAFISRLGECRSTAVETG